MQDGKGLQAPNLVDQIADAVIKKIDAHKLQTNPRWRYYERSPPTVVSVESSDTQPPVHFSTTVTETDMNDVFDEQSLLKKVPKPFKKNASLLLKEFDQRPNELTWDSAGHIYIDEKVLPNANIFDLFTRLFSKRVSKKGEGMQDFLEKIAAMGLQHLIRAEIKLKSNVSTIIDPTPTSSEKWWYIGE